MFTTKQNTQTSSKKKTKVNGPRVLTALVVAIVALIATGGAAGASQYHGADNPYEEYRVRFDVKFGDTHRIDDACGGPEFTVFGAVRDHDPEIGEEPVDIITNQILGIGEVSDDNPDLSLDNIVMEVEMKTYAVNAAFDLWERDDFFCGGGDDHIDVSPLKGKGLRIRVDTYGRRIHLRDSDDNWVHIGDVPKTTGAGVIGGTECFVLDANSSPITVDLCVTLEQDAPTWINPAFGSAWLWSSIYR